MASWQTYFVSAFLRLMVKNRLQHVSNIPELRKQRDAKTRRLVPPPEARFIPGACPSLDGTATLKLEWIHTPQVSTKRVILYFHGGGYVAGSAQCYRDLTWRLGKAADADVAAVDYRLAPEHPCPAAIDDAEAAYRHLLENGYAPKTITVAGDSAGGGLAMALLLRLKAVNLPQPAAAIGLSPWVDLRLNSDALKRFKNTDVILNADDMVGIASHYLQGLDAASPDASPIMGDLSGLCPVMVHVGSKEILLDDATRLCSRINDAGGDAQLKIWHNQPHIFQLFSNVLPEGDQSIAELGQFVRQKTSNIRNCTKLS